MPKISIVLPTYNGERFLSKSIESVLNQNEKDLELIIVNDCSTDKTAEIIASYAQNDKRIRVITNPVNKKLPASLNEGFKQARGKYLTWTSDDNYYLPNALQKMSLYLDNHSDVSFVYANFDIVDENGKVISHEKVKDPSALYEGCCIGACFLYKREIWEQLGHYRDDLFCAEDYEYWLRIYTSGFKMVCLSDVLYCYTKNSASLTFTKQKLVQQKTVQTKLEYLDKFSISDKKKAASLFKQYKRQKEEELLKIIKKLSPFWCRFWLLKLKLKGK